MAYTINGVEYQSIDEVPAEYRGLLSEILKNPSKDSKITVTKQNYLLSGPSDAVRQPNRKKFLEEVVLPNLHLMDDKTREGVLRELHHFPSPPKRRLP